ncbi:hypothetical protein SAMN04489724_2549 [Algoriphagus locisalis]|uniref:Uncharacterized protein n=1 Tax=Algoriphagus locisalis TaxID=305507 RepID=A0A1I7BMK9_9BACT|nr:hypothetical protein SAMN04489724_2549 [Algoriphagus locisalis]
MATVNLTFRALYREQEEISELAELHFLIFSPVNILDRHEVFFSIYKFRGLIYRHSNASLPTNPVYHPRINSYFIYPYAYSLTGLDGSICSTYSTVTDR